MKDLLTKYNSRSYGRILFWKSSSGVVRACRACEDGTSCELDVVPAELKKYLESTNSGDFPQALSNFYTVPRGDSAVELRVRGLGGSGTSEAMERGDIKEIVRQYVNKELDFNATYSGGRTLLHFLIEAPGVIVSFYPDLAQRSPWAFKMLKDYHGQYAKNWHIDTNWTSLSVGKPQPWMLEYPKMDPAHNPELEEKIDVCDQMLVLILREGKINPNVKDDRGYTPLHSAVSYGRMKSVELLAFYEADLSVTNNRGESLVTLANLTNISVGDFTDRAEIANLVYRLGSEVVKKDSSKRFPWQHGRNRRGEPGVFNEALNDLTNGAWFQISKTFT